jgi:hypothetical protein
MPAGFASRVAKLPGGDGSGSSQRVYDFPPLAIAREAFAMATGISDWPDNPGQE